MYCGLSTADGFMNVKEGVDEMLKYLANEPSVGLFFVQQHAQASMPYLLNIKDKVVEKVHEVTLHTEDIEDSICVVKSMTEWGLPIADQMFKDINKSLLIMSTSHPKKGLIRNPGWGFQPRSSGMNTRTALDYGGSSHGYLSAVFSSAKQRAAGLRWPQRPKGDRLSSAINIDALPTFPDVEADELPLSSQLVDDQLGEDTADDSSHSYDMPSVIEDYDRLKSDKEAKLERWLQES